MKIIIITQNEPFYLGKNLKFLFENISKKHEVVGVIISSVSPFGKKESFLKKTLKTYRIFGLRFLLFYSGKYLFSKLFSKQIRNFR